MIRLCILAALVLLSCKKQEVEKEEVKTPKVFSSKRSGAATFDINLNGVKTEPPFTVYKNDNVSVNCKSQPSMPTSYDMTVLFYVDGAYVGGCANCSVYGETFTIQ